MDKIEKVQTSFFITNLMYLLNVGVDVINLIEYKSI